LPIELLQQNPSILVRPAMAVTAADNESVVGEVDPATVHIDCDDAFCSTRRISLFVQQKKKTSFIKILLK
jgi:hypothetical protein